MEKFKALIRTLMGKVDETGDQLNQETQALSRHGWAGMPDEMKQNMLGRGMMAAGTTSGVTPKGRLLRPLNVSSEDMMLEKLKNLTQRDRGVMGQLSALVEQGKGRSNLGRTGQDAQMIAEGLGMEPWVGNQRLASFFDRMLQMADEAGIKPKR